MKNQKLSIVTASAINCRMAQLNEKTFHLLLLLALSCYLLCKLHLHVNEILRAANSLLSSP